MKEHIKHRIRKATLEGSYLNGGEHNFIRSLEAELIEHGYTAHTAMKLIGECISECMQEGPDGES